MTPEQKAARAIRHTTIRSITKNLGYSYLGFNQTPAQLRSAARRLYQQSRALIYPSRFHWENNNHHAS